MKKIAGLAAFVGTLAMMAGATPVPAADAQVAQAAAGMSPKQLYMRNTCIACHGRDGKMSILDYPNIAGQDQKYLEDQMKDIRDGKRLGSNDATGNPRTKGMRDVLVLPDGTFRLNDAQFKELTTWLASLEPAPPAPAGDAKRAEEGKALYTKNKCQTCHGVDGKKPTVKGYPIVAGQKKDYIMIQVKDMRDGKRTNGKSKLMVPNIKKMTDQEIELVAEYLSQIDRTAK
jgi:cytochrome c553